MQRARNGGIIHPSWAAATNASEPRHPSGGHRCAYHFLRSVREGAFRDKQRSGVQPFSYHPFVWEPA